jgi:signal transduction histidine kinase
MTSGEATWHENALVPITRNGKREDVYWTYSYGPIDDEEAANGIGGVLVICTETTSQMIFQRNTEALRLRQEMLLERLPGFIAMLEGPDHVFQYANRAYEAISNGRALMGLSVRQAFPDLIGQGFYELLDKVYSTGERYSANAIPIQLANQADPLYIDLLYEPIRSEAGKVTGILVSGYDVTAAARTALTLEQLNDTLEHRVEERTLQLKDSLDFARLAFSAVGGVGVWTYDAITDVFSYDNAIAELYDLDPKLGPAGIPRKDFLANVHPDDRSSLSVTMSGGLVRPGDLELEYRLIHADGSVRTVLSKGHTYFDEQGKPVRRTGVGVDLTDKRALEEQVRQSQKMEAVGQLSGGLAHDFNNLLAAIGGSLSMMQTRLTQGRIGELDKYVTGALGAVKRGANLTQRMLAFSRRQTLDPQATDINRLVDGMLDLIGRSVGPSIRIETVAGTELWPTHVDASQLENALLNLCINARDAMPDGGRLTIKTSNLQFDERMARDRGLTPGPYASLCVSDTGVGMSKETVVRAFDPFYTTKPIGQGTGLGLSMVHGFAGQSGGAARIDSVIGEGTTVCIYLPRHHTDALAGESVPAGDMPRSDNRETVMLVDDEPLLRMVASEQLEELGYRVIEAEDGPSALRLLAEYWPIDLLITDVGLPNGMNGRQLADTIRVEHPELKVLFVTGYAENAVLNQGHLDPDTQVLTKPFDADVFARRVKAIIGDR